MSLLMRCLELDKIVINVYRDLLQNKLCLYVYVINLMYDILEYKLYVAIVWPFSEDIVCVL